MTITSCSGTGVPPVSDLDVRFGRAFGSMTVPAACLPRRSGTKAGILDCARQAKRDAAFLVGRCRQARCSRAASAILKYDISNFKSPAPLPSQTEWGAHASRVPSLPNPNSTPDIQINLKIKPKSDRVRPKNESVIAFPDISPLSGVPRRLIQPIEAIF
jgi:hypothetical protein